ncbi:MAG: NUDIX domain-containing protein, partial [Comamonas sp.]
MRPLGGGVELGERWQTALAREFKEELNVDVEVNGPPHVMENIYTHHGATGHEVLFIGHVQFDAQAF